MLVSAAAHVIRRLVGLLAVLVGATTLTFLVFHVFRAEAFDDPRPLVVQLGEFLERAFLHLDLGRSWAPGHRRVVDIVGEGLPGDLSLLAGGLVIGVVAGFAGGALCGVNPRAAYARALQAGAALVLCAPVYWVGLVLIVVFAPGVGVIGLPFVALPNTYVPLSQDPGEWAHALFVPWLVLAAPLAAVCLRMMRASMREVLDEDFIRTASAKGLRRRTVVARHAMPVAAAPVVALVGVNTVTLVTNAVLLEQVYGVPGAFRTLTRSLNDGDFPVIEGITVVLAAVVVLGNWAADVAHALIDPRVRA